MENLPDFEKAELARLHEEIQKDRDLQFRVFWQAITITTILFSLLANVRIDIVINFPFIMISPHFILLSSASIILNRARTGNRKNAYILTKFDTFAKFGNWEKDLALLRSLASTNKSKNSFIETRAHRAATLRSMIIAISLLEILCLLALYLFSFSKFEEHPDIFYLKIIDIFCYFYSALYFSLLAKRLRSYFCTRYETSIQGYANIWADVLDINKIRITNFPYWEIKDWKRFRDNELSFRSEESLLGINWSSFIWRLAFKKPSQSLSNRFDRAEPSWIKPIIFSIIFTGTFHLFFSKFFILEIILKG